MAEPHVLIGKPPHGHWRSLTFVGALRIDRIDAPCVFDGPINGESDADAVVRNRTCLSRGACRETERQAQQADRVGNAQTKDPNGPSPGPTGLGPATRYVTRWWRRLRSSMRIRPSVRMVLRAQCPFPRLPRRTELNR